MLIPNSENPSEVAAFNALIEAGESRVHITLPVNLKAFLIGCLIEHMHDPEIVHCVLALGWLESVEKSGASRTMSLKRVGDASLLLAGLYPERVLRLNVSSRYFRSMGQASYASLAAHLETGPAVEHGRFYNAVAREFVSLERVLNGARGKAADNWEAYRRFRAQLDF